MPNSGARHPHRLGEPALRARILSARAISRPRKTTQTAAPPSAGDISSVAPYQPFCMANRHILKPTEAAGPAGRARSYPYMHISPSAKSHRSAINSNSASAVFARPRAPSLVFYIVLGRSERQRQCARGEAQLQPGRSANSWATGVSESSRTAGYGACSTNRVLELGFVRKEGHPTKGAPRSAAPHSNSPILANFSLPRPFGLDTAQPNSARGAGTARGRQTGRTRVARTESRGSPGVRSSACPAPYNASIEMLQRRERLAGACKHSRAGAKARHVMPGGGTAPHWQTSIGG